MLVGEFTTIGIAGVLIPPVLFIKGNEIGSSKIPGGLGIPKSSSISSKNLNAYTDASSVYCSSLNNAKFYWESLMRVKSN